jgi:ATP adenylyltransferase
MQWVTRERPSDDGDAECIFCALPVGESDRENNIVARSRHAYVLLNNMPYNPGHLMVLPYEHTGEFYAIDDDDLLDYMKTAQKTMYAVQEALSPDGFNVGFNIGSAGGASIDDHLHMHIIPRWESDTSFMPLTANTAIVEEAVDETYERLHDALSELSGTEAGSDADAIELTH